MQHQAVFERISPLVLRGLAATCAALDFEALFSSRRPSEYEDIKLRRALSYAYLPTIDRDWQRALEIQGEFARQSRLREVGINDLLIAAVAERESVELIHYDADFVAIARFTGQRCSWVVPQGSIA